MPFLLLSLVAQDKAKPLQTPTDKNGLPLPFGIEHDRANAGDALAPYAFLAKREKEYADSDMWADTYFEARATCESFVGLTTQAIATYAKSRSGQMGSARSGAATPDKPLEDFAPRDAVQFLLEKAEGTKCMMIGESHHMPQTRVIGIRLLRGLWQRGYRYLAAETFSQPVNPNFDKEMNNRKYPLVTTGYYSQEPVFGELVRTAQRIGFKLVPYEMTDYSKGDSKDPNARAQSREDQQAVYLKAIFDKDRNAKVLVWNGYSHNYEGRTNDGLMLMGGRFKETTGIDPYTVSQYTTAERDKPESELPAYRYAADHGMIKDETVFVTGNGKAYAMSEGNDCAVFLPRTKPIQGGRPDWLQRDLGRASITVPEELVVGNGLHLAQAFYEGEPSNAVPVDQIVIPAGSKAAVLQLPMNEKLWIRVLDEAGKESVHKPIHVRPLALDTPEELAKITHPELREELAKRVKEDQDMRFRIIDAQKKGATDEEIKTMLIEGSKVDQANTAWLKGIIDKLGWPTKKMVGRAGAHNAWLLVQHADLDKPFQRRCLDLMKPHVATDQVGKADFAYLTDRVLIGEGKKQLYGTQCTSDGKGGYMPLPVEDPANVDKRRSEVGLGTMAEYLKMMLDVNGPSRKGGG